VDYRNHFIAARNRQFPARAEIILHVDDKKDVLGSDLHVVLTEGKLCRTYAASTISIRKRLPTARAAFAMV